MRPVWMLCGVTLLLLLGPSVPADPGESPATVLVPEADVWSKPGTSPSVYATGKLRQGAAVTVLKTLEGDWLAIKPPDGSIDWVSDQAVTVNSGIATVKTEVPTRIGLSGQADAAGFDRAKIEGARLQPGSLVLLAGQAVTSSDGSKWWPIQPPPSEERYLRAESIKQPPAVQSVSATAPAHAETPGSMSTGTEPLLMQAQQAEQAGNFAEAERLYTQLARQTPNHDLMTYCYSRIQYLRDRTHTAAAVPGYPAQANYPAAVPGVAPAQPALLPGALPPGTPPAPVTVGQAPPLGYTPQPAPSLPAQQCSGRGWLRRCGFYLDNKPTYVLQSSEGRPPLYVTAQGQLNLEPYLFRNVELLGPMVYRGDVKGNYMTAVQVVPVP